MAVPTSRFRRFPGSDATTLFDTPAERIAALTGDASVAHGSPPAGGTPVDFGIVDISGGAANSAVQYVRWDITADGGNTLAEDFRLWHPAADNGFDQAGTVVKIEAISGADQGTPTNTSNYVQNPVVGSFTWGNIPSTDPGSINLWPTDEGTSMVLSTASDDVVAWANYLAVDAAETTGTYEAATSGFEFRMTFQYSYS
jgi:hypothetical protein